MQVADKVSCSLSLSSQTTASNAAMKDDLRRGGYTVPSSAKKADLIELRKSKQNSSSLQLQQHCPAFEEC